MNKIIENAVKANFENYRDFFNNNLSEFDNDKLNKYYHKLCRYHKIYGTYNCLFTKTGA